MNKMSVKNLLINIENFLGIIKCTHRSVKNYSCNFCPDCGQKVIVRWVSIKCRQCGHLRTAGNKNLNLIVPKKIFCCYCGSDKWSYQYYYDSNIPDKLREISLKQVVIEKENPFKDNNINVDTKIWIEKPQNNQKKYKSNVIKAHGKWER
jgi:predicted RNA-binding Zn-ribbon protein involved in translation (DUF1610 family)